MKHALAVLTTAALLGSAHAQQATTFKSGDLMVQFLGCVTGDSAQTVVCSLRSTLTGRDSATTHWAPHDLSYFLNDGTSSTSSYVGGAGAPLSSSVADVYQIRDVPTTVKWALSLPTKPAQLRALIVLGHRFDNVPVRDPNAVQPAAPTPVATVTRSGNAPAPVPGFSGYTITLTNCTPSGQALACSALLTPSR